MENFSFIFAFESLAAPKDVSEIEYFLNMHKDACGKLLYRDGLSCSLGECLERLISEDLQHICDYGMVEFNVQLRYACAFFYDYPALTKVKVDQSELNKTEQTVGLSFAKWFKHYRNVVGNIVKRGRIIAVENLERVIRTELTKPRTAFVTFSEHADDDWVFFEKFMEKSTVRFVRSEEQSWDFKLGYTFSSGFNHNLASWLWRRVTHVMEAGFYNLWIRWERARRLPLSRKVNKREPLPKAFMKLSFVSSDVHLTFLLYGLCIAAAAVVVTIEVATIL